MGDSGEQPKPLFMQMTYSCAGWVAEMAPDPVWLGSFVRCTLELPEIFQNKCFTCGKMVLPLRYCSSPLYGRVDLEGKCECGWKGFEMVYGWQKRAKVLRGHMSSDRYRNVKFRLLVHLAQPSALNDLMNWLKA